MPACRSSRSKCATHANGSHVPSLFQARRCTTQDKILSSRLRSDRRSTLKCRRWHLTSLPALNMPSKCRRIVWWKASAEEFPLVMEKNSPRWCPKMDAFIDIVQAEKPQSQRSRDEHSAMPSGACESSICRLAHTRMLSLSADAAGNERQKEISWLALRSACRQPDTQRFLEFFVELRCRLLRAFGRSIDFTCSCHATAIQMKFQTADLMSPLLCLSCWKCSGHAFGGRWGLRLYPCASGPHAEGSCSQRSGMLGPGPYCQARE